MAGKKKNMQGDIFLGQFCPRYDSGSSGEDTESQQSSIQLIFISFFLQFFWNVPNLLQIPRNANKN